MPLILSHIEIWKQVIQIGILWFIIYHILLFFEGTRALQVLRGIILLLAAFFLFQLLGLRELNWLLTKLFAISVIAILIIFQTEIRQGLARLGQRHIFSTALREEEMDYVIRQISIATENLCNDKSGALIAIEKSDQLTPYIESGISIDAKISSDLIENIFTPKSPLHDGGLIIQNARISAAGCLFPLTQNQDLSRVFGTRHRAALGLSEEVDAIIIVVSEERHNISLVHNAKLYKDISGTELENKIKELWKAKRT